VHEAYVHAPRTPYLGINTGDARTTNCIYTSIPLTLSYSYKHFLYTSLRTLKGTLASRAATRPLRYRPSPQTTYQSRSKSPYPDRVAIMTMVTGTIPPPGIKRQPHLAGRLLGDHKDHSSSSTITAMAQSADPSASSTTNLFPTTTAGRGDSVAGPGSANVYYLVVSLA
jgi:hypothetical protein